MATSSGVSDAIMAIDSAVGRRVEVDICAPTSGAAPTTASVLSPIFAPTFSFIPTPASVPIFGAPTLAHVASPVTHEKKDDKSSDTLDVKPSICRAFRKPVMTAAQKRAMVDKAFMDALTKFRDEIELKLKENLADSISVPVPSEFKGRNPDDVLSLKRLANCYRDAGYHVYYDGGAYIPSITISWYL